MPAIWRSSEVSAASTRACRLRSPVFSYLPQFLLIFFFDVRLRKDLFHGLVAHFRV
ncbi:hypothetical protein [Neomoorella glycerini]|uniref:hypothetical protein n=1 Tax=Neomoorella glycerini TaxID=55779 RepID=UPI0012E1C5D5|nr:hypothetical protein [Moorella glycerini]